MIVRPPEEEKQHGKALLTNDVENSTYFVVQEDILDEVDLMAEDQGNKQTLKFVSIGSQFRVVLKVKEHFGYGGTSATNDDTEDDA